jgi:3-hydroxy-9,10-secoandrosta-1,3,5(10)-triene-9,17-dione monooxygenase reductase component
MGRGILSHHRDVLPLVNAQGPDRMKPMTNKEVERRALRDALGQFVTGVTVVTTRTAAGEPAGLTVNSFTSLSLDPPLVLWNLGWYSAKRDSFNDAAYFAVNVLAAAQERLALDFARPAGNPFAGLQTDVGAGDVPLLTGCIAYFECRLTHRYPGGDHDMLIGEVLRYRSMGGEPLLFSRGRFGRFQASS